jgi:hypothetical protein
MTRIDQKFSTKYLLKMKSYIYGNEENSTKNIMCVKLHAKGKELDVMISNN